MARLLGSQLSSLSSVSLFLVSFLILYWLFITPGYYSLQGSQIIIMQD